MFTKYFNLSEQPFGTTPDPRFLFNSDSHREALASLYCAFYANRGFTALIAEPGMGKTTLLFEFLERMRGCAKTIFLFNTFCSPDDIVAYILRDSGLEPGPTVAERYRQINDLLAAEAKLERPVVLVVDESQNLSTHTLEGIRMLTNFETTRSKLIQVILAGQPQLAQMLARPELAQLRQRISTLCQIKPLTAAETRSYIQHRLKFAGYSGDELFTADAFDLIAEASSGIPRVINTLCFNALCFCRARNARHVHKGMVGEAIEDLELPVCSVQFPSTPSHISGGQQAPDRRKRKLFAGIVPLVCATALVLGICGILLGTHFWNDQSARQLHSMTERMTPSDLEKVASHREHAKQAAGKSAEAILVYQNATPTPVQPIDTRMDSAPELVKVQVLQGDTLAAISTAHLGTFNSRVLRKMLELNPKLTNPDHIETGETIRLPRQLLLQTVETTSKRNEP